MTLKHKKKAAGEPARFIPMPPKWGPGVRAGRKRTPEENAARTLAKKAGVRAQGVALSFKGATEKTISIIKNYGK